MGHPRDRDMADGPQQSQSSTKATFSGMTARVIQHETDHLDGVLFIDHLSKLKRDRCIKKFAKQAKERERGA